MSLNTKTLPLNESEMLGADLLVLLEYFRAANSIREGSLDTMGLHHSRRVLVNLGWLLPVSGPGRYDDDLLIPVGPLRQRVIESRSSAVENAWANYKERRA